ncbi:MAG TPA: TetR/AcrR family transcriptional regulator [Xanthobacteraceae bacterium]|jgi:AcrR family transcriptional regulator|nr:TetR/AcrR family transcriptional regulator [Xanthobacteraceae bacterium]
MARRPARKAAPKNAGASAAPPPLPSDANDRAKIIAAFLGLLAEKRFEQIGLGEIAEAAGVSLAQFRGEFASPLAILAAHVKDTDRAVLGADFSDMAEEPPRERIFDVLMRRLEILAPHREAVRSLLRSASRNPPLAMAFNGLAVRSQQWMLTAAGIGASGPRGMVRAQGLALLFGSVLRTWVHDDDPGLARTMAALDRALGRGQRFAGLFEDLCRVPERLCRLRSRRRRRSEDDSEEAAAA